MPALVLVLWLLSTLSWWAFAFMPLPARTPDWLEAARLVCFGAMETGIPDASGWILLAGAPLTLLAVIVAVWGRELRASVHALTRSREGQALVAVIALAVLVEGGWVAATLTTARQITTAGAATTELPSALPDDYPRQGTMAPDFALVDQHGATVSLRQFRGRPVVLTFVFAHCQTMCPVLVDTVKRATAGAPATEALLVTLDPWRDTVSALPTIARQWDVPRGGHVLSAARAADVLAVIDAYKVPAERNETTGDVAHPGLVFVVDRDGRLAFTFNNPPVAWVREALDRLGRSDHRVVG